MQGCRGAGMQGCRGAGMQGCRGAGMQGCSGAAVQGCRDAGMQGCRDAGVQGCRDAGVQGCRDTEKRMQRHGRVDQERPQLDRPAAFAPNPCAPVRGHAASNEALKRKIESLRPSHV
eukprot:364775-Chlamydomonas_euryale.AAC.2